MSDAYFDVLVSNKCQSCSLVAIARDEAPYIAEWLAFHLAVGFTRILVFDHGSLDGTAEIVARAAAVNPAISLHAVSEEDGRAPQVAAYAAALDLVRTPWIAFFDIDEFLVPWRDGSVSAYLARVPDDVSAVHINWRSFGSAGLHTRDDRMVIEAFTRCAAPDWAYQGHYKTLARRAHVGAVQVHEVVLTEGRRTLSDFTEIPAGTVGMTDRIVYDGIQLNHYQCKTFEEFERRMSLPSAGSPRGHRLVDLNLRFRMLDRNELGDGSIAQFSAAMRRHRALIVNSSQPTSCPVQPGSLRDRVLVAVRWPSVRSSPMLANHEGVAQGDAWDGLMPLDSDTPVALGSSHQATIEPFRSWRAGFVAHMGQFVVPLLLWIAFANVANRYHDVSRLPDAALHDVVEAELATRRCPGLRLDPDGFRQFAREHGINHADLYQKRSPQLQKAVDRLDRNLRNHPEDECQKMIDRYEKSFPNLIKGI